MGDAAARAEAPDAAGGAANVACTDLVVSSRVAPSSARRYRAQLISPYGRAVVAPWQESATCAFVFGDDAMTTLDDGRPYEIEWQAKDATAGLLFQRYAGILGDVAAGFCGRGIFVHPDGIGRFRDLTG